MGVGSIVRCVEWPDELRGIDSCLDFSNTTAYAEGFRVLGFRI